MDFSEINKHYRLNPPDTVLDDLGIFVPVEVPLPAKYTRHPCSCGIIHKWESPATFEILEHFSFGSMIPHKYKKCKTCKETLVLKLYKE